MLSLVQQTTPHLGQPTTPTSVPPPPWIHGCASERLCLDPCQQRGRCYAAVEPWRQARVHGTGYAVRSPPANNQLPQYSAHTLAVDAVRHAHVHVHAALLAGAPTTRPT